MAPTPVAINGFGRIGRLVARVLEDRPELGLSLAHVNEVAGGAATGAHLLAFDSVHGRWREDEVRADGSDALLIGQRRVRWSAQRDPVAVDWTADGVRVVLDALSTRVVDGRHVKVLAWYDNEWGYAHRMAELAAKVAAA